MTTMTTRPIPTPHWRSYGDDPLPTGKQALDGPFAAFPSWRMSTRSVRPTYWMARLRSRAITLHRAACWSSVPETASHCGPGHKGLGGATMGGPRHLFWNLVSSSRERIEQAKADWKAGRFGKVPGDEVEFIPLPERRT
jgi:Pirin C-terminal cupin domain